MVGGTRSLFFLSGFEVYLSGCGANRALVVFTMSCEIKCIVGPTDHTPSPHSLVCSVGSLFNLCLFVCLFVFLTLSMRTVVFKQIEYFNVNMSRVGTSSFLVNHV